MGSCEGEGHSSGETLLPPLHRAPDRRTLPLPGGKEVGHDTRGYYHWPRDGGRRALPLAAEGGGHYHWPRDVEGTTIGCRGVVGLSPATAGVKAVTPN